MNKEIKDGITGRRKVIDGFECFEMVHEGKKIWMPVNPDKAYAGKGWKGWKDFLGKKKQ